MVRCMRQCSASSPLRNRWQEIRASICERRFTISAVRGISCLIAVLCCSLAPAASVDEIVADALAAVEPDELTEPGSSAYAEALAERVAAADDLSAEQAIDLELRLVEAWLACGELMRAVPLLGSVARKIEASSPHWQRYGLASVAAWQVELTQVEDLGAFESASERLRQLGEFPPLIRARALSIDGQYAAAAKDFDAAMKRYDAALALLEQADAAERVPVYALRMLAMEGSGMPREEIEAWIEAHRDDPAIATVAEQTFTAAERMIGSELTPMAVPRLGEEGPPLDLPGLRGRPVLLYFFATWCKPCGEYSPVIAAFAAAQQDVQVIGISFDTAETLAQLDAYRAKYGVSYPIYGEGAGWDGGVDEAWHVDAIPHCILLAPDGSVAAADLIGVDGVATAERLEAALQALDQAAAPGISPPPVDGPEDIP